MLLTFGLLALTSTVFASALNDYSTIVLCPVFFKGTRRVKPKEKDFSLGSLASYMIHEMTHLSVIRDPPAGDYAYELHRLKKLPHEKAVDNAETFAMFASGKPLRYNFLRGS